MSEFAGGDFTDHTDDRIFDDGSTTAFLAVEAWLRDCGVNVAGLRLPKEGGWVVVDGDTYRVEAF